MQGPSARFLPDGRRLHLQHGPIDLIIDAEGPGRDAALIRANARFETVLTELVSELPLLRSPAQPEMSFSGPVARRMAAAVVPHLPVFVTPMAAVAGAVADEVLAALVSTTDPETLSRAWVNNGGDIAFHLTPGQRADAAIAVPGSARIAIAADDPVRGIATSGWRGRSHSLGIADSVTVLAATAAAADVAATLIANAVDLPDHPAVRREPASALSPDSDLGDRLVTVSVGELSSAESARALDRGQAVAARMLDAGLIGAAYLVLGDETRSVGAKAITASCLDSGINRRYA